MGGLLGRASEHERVEALLSVYMDGRTSRAERALVEHHLKSCAECTRNLATLRATVTAVREMPRVRAPRSFALSRAMAKQRRSAPWTYPLLRAATAFATLLFAIVIGADALTRNMVPTVGAPQAAATAPARIAMQSATTSESAAPKAATQNETTPSAQQPAATPAPTSGREAYGLAAAPGTSTPAPAPKVVPPSEKPLGGAPGGVTADNGLGGGGPAAGAPASTGTQPPESQPGAATPSAPSIQAPSAAVPPTPAPTGSAPPEIARGAAPREPVPQAPPHAAPEQGYSVQRPPSSTFHIAEGALAVLAIVLGAATWAVRRRNR